MGKIFCLMGKSSSGKDTLFKLLKEDKELNLQPVIPYTTRPRRNNEENGVDYYFIDKEALGTYEKLGKIIEKRLYNTINGIWYYCTIDDGQIDLSRGNYLLIVTLEAYKSLKMYFGDENVIPIYITVDDAVRLERAVIREKQQIHPNYDELCRRFLADNADFSIDKLNENNIEKWYNNINLDVCVKHIKEDLMKLI